ncbi:hypothetical protein GTZ99_13965 [Novosphingobium sp. FSY-8]|uniref:O-antigen ligase-related domain-containing protein n=1 Tax=Novosphingobium ovatum TaxID=1908523 RepID=A0ABW9XGH4_9SPHN|nr:O-antigen ligase family protein [Novosphingobium ovatum]NBC37657.1 hypothetical protein [Novosphingobium ovatum]
MVAQRYLVAAYALWIVVLGGGGLAYPGREMIAEFGAAILFAVWWFEGPRGRFDPKVRRNLMILVALVLVLPIVQLVPLPPAVWHALPGREIERATLALIGRENSWRPMSMTPDRSLALLLSMLPPLAMLLMVSSMSVKDRMWPALAFAVASLGSMLLGLLATVGKVPLPHVVYTSPNLELLGFVISKNVHADMLLIGMLAAVYAFNASHNRNARARSASYQLLVSGLICAAFSVGVVLTKSRMGIMLLPLALVGAAAMLGSGNRIWTKSLWFGAAGLALVAGTMALVASNNVLVVTLLERFHFKDEMRATIWADSYEVMKVYWPYGAGMGSFMSVFPMGERLEAIQPLWIPRAHNDYLELAIEAGIPGLVCLAAILVMVGGFAVAALRRRGQDRDQRRAAYFALTAFAILALHSLVDYPFRYIATATMAAFAVAMLMPEFKPDEGAGADTIRNPTR